MHIALASVIFLLVALGGFALSTRTAPVAPISTDPNLKVETIDTATTTAGLPVTEKTDITPIKVEADGDLKVETVPLEN